MGNHGSARRLTRRAPDPRAFKVIGVTTEGRGGVKAKTPSDVQVRPWFAFRGFGRASPGIQGRVVQALHRRAVRSPATPQRDPGPHHRQWATSPGIAHGGIESDGTDRKDDHVLRSAPYVTGRNETDRYLYSAMLSRLRLFATVRAFGPVDSLVAPTRASRRLKAF